MQVPDYAGVKVAAAGTHWHAAGGRKAHSHIDWFGIFGGTQADAAAQVRHNHFAVRSYLAFVFGKILEQVLIRQAVKAVASQA
jgi:hypothetical protein